MPMKTPSTPTTSNLEWLMRLFLFSAFLFYALLVSPTASGQPHTIEINPGGTNSPCASEVCFVIDRSGSMIGSRIDLAKDAAQKAIGTLEAGSGLAVVSFSSSASTTFPFSLVTSSTKQSAQNAIEGIRASGSTSIGSGLLQGDNELKKGGNQADKSLILLSDGQENRPPYVADVLPLLSSSVNSQASKLIHLRNEISSINDYNGPTIHTIALGTSTDQGLLSEIAELTNGIYLFVSSPDDLPQVFIEILSRVSSEQVLLTFEGSINAQSSIEHSFSIGSDIQTIKITTLYQDAQLDISTLGPQGIVYNSDNLIGPVKYTEGNGYTSYTVYELQPGEWRALIENNGSQLSPYSVVVTAETSLTLDVSFSQDTYSLGENIFVVAELLEDNAPVLGATVTADVTTPATAINSALTLYDEGVHGDGAANDGIYGNFFSKTDMEGSYTFAVTAKGSSPSGTDFVRRATRATFVEATALTSCPGTLRLTDFDADQPGSPDTQEFIEITNSGTTSASLDECTLVLYDGKTDASYYAIALEGSLSPGATHILGNSQSGDVDQIFPDNTLQNGPDAIALYRDDVASFPNNTPITVNNLISAIVYIDDDTVVGTSKIGQTPAEILLNLPEAARGANNSEVPRRFALDQNYPNPFNPTTTIRFSLPETSIILLSIYDLLGRKVQDIASGEHKPGWHTVVWNGQDSQGIEMPSGLYIYRLEKDGMSYSRNMLLLR